MSQVNELTAGDPDQAILDAFGRWCDLALLEPPEDDDGTIANAMNIASDDIALAIAIMPIAGMTGLAVKFYVAIHAEIGGLPGNSRAINLANWQEDLLPQNLIAGVLADLMRLNPAIAELVGAKTFI